MSVKIEKRPTLNGEGWRSMVTTPLAAKMIGIIGNAMQSEAVMLSQDQFRHIKKLYGFKPEKRNKKPPPPEPPNEGDFPTQYEFQQAMREHEAAYKRWETWQDPQPLMQAGADRNAIRYAEADGLRLLAFMAKFIPPGEDPLKHFIRIAVNHGWDIDPEDREWAFCDVEECVEEDAG